MSLQDENGKGLPEQDLQNTPDSAAPNASPQIEKTVILDALKGMDRADLLALLTEALSGKGDDA